MQIRSYPHEAIGVKRYVLSVDDENEMDILMQAIDDIGIKWRDDYVVAGLSVYFDNEAHRTMILLKGKI